MYVCMYLCVYIHENKKNKNSPKRCAAQQPAEALLPALRATLRRRYQGHKPGLFNSTGK